MHIIKSRASQSPNLEVWLSFFDVPKHVSVHPEDPAWMSIFCLIDATKDFYLQVSAWCFPNSFSKPDIWGLALILRMKTEE